MLNRPIIWKIKELITDDEDVKDQKENYLTYIHERRDDLADLLLNPNPVGAIKAGDEEYTG